ncbi:MAG: hypothetical protein ABEK59_03230 [Halobacteria archaeon]
MSQTDGNEVIGGFSIRKPGSFGSPQAVGTVDEDGRTVSFHKLSSSIHYYFIPSLVGAVGFASYGIPGIVAGVVLGTALMMAGKKLKYKRALKKLEAGKKELSHDIVVKKGKLKKVKLDEGKLRKSLYLETPKEELHILGDSTAITRLQEILL